MHQGYRHGAPRTAEGAQRARAALRQVSMSSFQRVLLLAVCTCYGRGEAELSVHGDDLVVRGRVRRVALRVCARAQGEA